MLPCHSRVPPPALTGPQVVADYNANPDVHGILVQLPLPKHIDEQRVLDAISIEKVGGASQRPASLAGEPCRPPAPLRPLGAAHGCCLAF